MPGLLRFLESCLLAATGIFMAGLAVSPIYWRFINPKYSWLTFSAGGILAVLGIYRLFQRSGKGDVTESTGLAVFLALAVAATLLPNPFFDFAPQGLSDDAVVETSAGTEEASVGEPASRIVIDGEEYVKINVAELLAGESEGWAQEGEKFVFRGIVSRTPELDAAGYIAVSRLFVFCCFADAVGVTYLVKLEEPQDYQTGEWVKVAGALAAGGGVDSQPPLVSGALSAVMSEKFVFMADSVEKSNMPDIPFIFQIRDKEPFAF